jgi:hypothetical protein
MAYYSVAGTGPVSFVDGSQNQQEIPLSEIFVTPNGVDASSWPLFGDNKALVPALLSRLVAQGAISASTTLATPMSLTAKAVQAGPMGNSITITFSNPSAAAGTVTIEVTAKEVYKGLTPASIGGALGTSAAAAEGLVYLSDAGTGQMPGNFTGAIGATFDVEVPDPSNPGKAAFKLAATSQDPAADAQLIQIAVVPDAGAPPTTFTLTASWTKTETDVTLSSLAATNPYGYLITFSGQSGPLPAAGSIALKGGTAASGGNPAVPASASLLSA